MLNQTRQHCCFTLLLALFITCSMPATVSADTSDAALLKASRLELEGQFFAASNTLNAALTAASPDGQRKQIEFELDRLNRICQDFSYSQDDLFSALQQSVSGLTKKEFEQWISEER